MPDPEAKDPVLRFRSIAPPAATQAEEDHRSPLMAELLGFLNDLCHPEQYGYAVTREVRQRARALAAHIEAEERIP